MQMFRVMQLHAAQTCETSEPRLLAMHEVVNDLVSVS
jgi:hypothetical protein